ncbi:hypothetical protein [Streptomyces antibioticus]|uniref:hypothetical protein n=1 Tax=Streptomyces antibioticus TaxID=1890 RepID=UPI003D72DE52
MTMATRWPSEPSSSGAEAKPWAAGEQAVAPEGQPPLVRGAAGPVEEARGDRAGAVVRGDHRRRDPVAVQPQRDRARTHRERLAAQARHRVTAGPVDPGDRTPGDRLHVLEQRQTAAGSGIRASTSRTPLFRRPQQPSNTQPRSA